MKKIKVAFYKNSKSIFGWLIRWKQEKKYPSRYARYSHVELVFEDGQSFSSSEQDWWVRFKDIKFIDYYWDFIELEMNTEKYNNILDFCKRQTWNSYNWFWIFFAQMFNFNLKWNWDWFCSEICSRALQEAWYLCAESSLFMDPGKLAMTLEKQDNNILLDKFK